MRAHARPREGSIRVRLGRHRSASGRAGEPSRASVATLRGGVNLAACDSQPVTPVAERLLDSRSFEHPFVLEASTMRTYAPAEPGAVLASLLAEPSLARGVDPPRAAPGARSGARGLPRLARWPDRRRTRGARDRSGRTPTRPRRSSAIHAGRDVVVVTPTASGKTPVLRPADPAGDRRRSGVAGAAALPDQGARPGPGHRVRRADGGGRADDLDVDL